MNVWWQLKRTDGDPWGLANAGHTWKVVYSSGERSAWGYWMTNTAGQHSMKPIDYAEFERRTGLALLKQPLS